MQDSLIKSAKGSLLGLHYKAQLEQGDLVLASQSDVSNVEEDIRKGSSTFGQCFGIELSAENNK